MGRLAGGGAAMGKLPWNFTLDLTLRCCRSGIEIKSFTTWEVHEPGFLCVCVFFFFSDGEVWVQSWHW